MLVNIFFICIAKCLSDNEHNSLYFVQKHPHIFVLGYDLFLKAEFFATWNRNMFADKYL